MNTHATAATRRLMELATAYWGSAALIASVSLGLWNALAEGPIETADLAHGCGCSTEHLEDLLQALEAMGVVQLTELGWEIAPEFRFLLDPSSETYLVPALALNADLYPLWGRLANCVQSGQPVVNPAAHLGADPDRTRRFVLAMHSRARVFAPVFMSALPLEGVRSLLDVGAGPGTFTRWLAERHPTLRVTQFDLPDVIRVAEELTSTSPAAERIQFVPGDYRRTESFGGPFDMILFCGALHQEDPDGASQLWRKFAQALSPKGRLAVIDLMRGHPSGGPMPALFSLQMRLTSPRGRVYSMSQVSAMLTSGGWTLEEARPLEIPPYGLILARPPHRRSNA